MFCKRNGSKVGCFADSCNHHTRAEQKQVFEQLLCEEKEYYYITQTTTLKEIFLTTIIDILLARVS